MLRVYLVEPPLSRVQVSEWLSKRPEWVAERVSVDPSDEVRVIVAKWNDRAMGAVERWLKRLGYAESRTYDPRLFNGATGTSWQRWVARQSDAPGGQGAPGNGQGLASAS